jgi:hypothetical protein
VANRNAIPHRFSPPLDALIRQEIIKIPVITIIGVCGSIFVERKPENLDTFAQTLMKK